MPSISSLSSSLQNPKSSFPFGAFDTTPVRVLVVCSLPSEFDEVAQLVLNFIRGLPQSPKRDLEGMEAKPPSEN